MCVFFKGKLCLNWSEILNEGLSVQMFYGYKENWGRGIKRNYKSISAPLYCNYQSTITPS